MSDFQPDSNLDLDLAADLLEARVQCLRTRLSDLMLNQDQPASAERNSEEIFVLAEFALLTPAILEHFNARAIEEFQRLLLQLGQQLQDTALNMQQQTQTDFSQVVIQVQAMMDQTSLHLKDMMGDVFARSQQSTQACYEEITDATTLALTRVTGRIQKLRLTLKILWFFVIILAVLTVWLNRLTAQVFDKQQQLNTALTDAIATIAECQRQGKASCEVKVSPLLPSLQMRRQR